MIFDFETYMKKINFNKYERKIIEILKKLNYDNMAGWYDISNCIRSHELEDVIETSKKIKQKCDVLLVIGIGGSFLGSKMVINALSNYFEKKDFEIIFVGTSLSSDYLTDVVEYIKNKDVCINLISKSGSTLEPNLVFDELIKIMKEKYNDFSDRVFITTDKEKSSLLDIAKQNNYKLFQIPETIGGRYSILTPVGLLPIAVAGFDIKRLLNGAIECKKNDAVKYAIIRHELYLSGKIVESFTFYDEKLLDFGEWLKQLFAESHGKHSKGILPISTLNTRDLHSLGQFFQDGNKILFETAINVQSDKVINTKFNKTLNDINNIAVEAAAKAHFENEVYTNLIKLKKLTEYELGYLIYFFELTAAIGGYLLEVNPFDQPGVNNYKNLINEKLKNDSL